jgi:molybdate transport system permease protein
VTISREDLSIAVFTLEMAFFATLLILPIGVAAAFALARYRGLGKDLIDTWLSLPLVLPPTAVGLLLLRMLERHALVGGFLHRCGVEVMFTRKAVILAMAVMSLPLLVRSARTSFAEIDPRLPAVARTLGRGPIYVFFRVTLPLAWRGILAGTLLAFSRALGEFGATILVAGNIPGRTTTLALEIFHRSEAGREDDALRLVAITVVVAFGCVFATEWIGSRRQRRFGGD